MLYINVQNIVNILGWLRLNIKNKQNKSVKLIINIKNVRILKGITDMSTTVLPVLLL